MTRSEAIDFIHIAASDGTLTDDEGHFTLSERDFDWEVREACPDWEEVAYDEWMQNNYEFAFSRETRSRWNER